MDYVSWVCDQDAYACSGQKCSAQSVLFMHEVSCFRLAFCTCYCINVSTLLTNLELLMLITKVEDIISCSSIP